MEKKTKKKIIETKKWTFIEKRYDDGTAILERTNKGFNIFELLGLAEMAQIEIVKMFNNELEYAKIIRKAIVK